MLAQVSILVEFLSEIVANKARSAVNFGPPGGRAGYVPSRVYWVSLLAEGGGGWGFLTRKLSRGFSAAFVFIYLALFCIVVRASLNLNAKS